MNNIPGGLPVIIAVVLIQDIKQTPSANHSTQKKTAQIAQQRLPSNPHTHNPNTPKIRTNNQPR